jgi:hypothetical protein
VIDVYAICAHPTAPLPDVAPLALVPAGELAAVVAPAAADGDDATPEALWRHEEIVEALMEDRDLLPVRYGTRFDDEQAAAGAVQQREAALVLALERVRGAVEVSLRVLDTRDPPAADAPDAVDQPLSELARASTRRPTRAPAEVLRAAYLIDRDAQRTFADRVADLQAANPELRLLCTGPWPPYSFVD